MKNIKIKKKIVIIIHGFLLYTNCANDNIQQKNISTLKNLSKITTRVKRIKNRTFRLPSYSNRYIHNQAYYAPRSNYRKITYIANSAIFGAMGYLYCKYSIEQKNKNHIIEQQEMCRQSPITNDIIYQMVQTGQQNDIVRKYEIRGIIKNHLSKCISETENNSKKAELYIDLGAACVSLGGHKEGALSLIEALRILENLENYKEIKTVLNLLDGAYTGMKFRSSIWTNLDGSSRITVLDDESDAKIYKNKKIISCALKRLETNKYVPIAKDLILIKNLYLQTVWFDKNGKEERENR